ncbi:hypothetical protein [Alphaproteobacteria bacterium endosymbiont of Tiliacea citrago]|uniref:hypothetical protein n=1 Tax=Alphaproteobacteria bacterium endosymbiont of Tiliacea citrago TaxID=3077944 RepID=UPI00313EB6F4
MINFKKNLYIMLLLKYNITSETQDRNYFLNSPSRLTADFFSENIGDQEYCLKLEAGYCIFNKVLNHFNQTYLKIFAEGYCLSNNFSLGIFIGGFINHFELGLSCSLHTKIINSSFNIGLGSSFDKEEVFMKMEFKSYFNYNNFYLGGGLGFIFCSNSITQENKPNKSYILFFVGYSNKTYYGEKLDNEINNFVTFLKDDSKTTYEVNRAYISTEYDCLGTRKDLYEITNFTKKFKDEKLYLDLKMLYEESLKRFNDLKDYEKIMCEGFRRYCNWYENK